MSRSALSVFQRQYAPVVRKQQERMFGVAGVVYVRGDDRRRLRVAVPLAAPVFTDAEGSVTVTADRRDWLVDAKPLAGLLPLRAGDRMEARDGAWTVLDGADWTDASMKRVRIPTQLAGPPA